MSESNNYGKKYFCIKVPSDISVDGEIYLHADRVEVRDGTLIFWGKYYPDKCDKAMGRFPDYENQTSDEMPLLILNKNCWEVYYAASCLDGHAVAVEHWRGEICSRRN